MSENKARQNTFDNLRVRTILMVVQILLPFGLFVALRWESPIAAGLIAGLFTISMGILVWLG